MHLHDNIDNVGQRREDDDDDVRGVKGGRASLMTDRRAAVTRAPEPSFFCDKLGELAPKNLPRQCYVSRIFHDSRTRTSGTFDHICSVSITS